MISDDIARMAQEAGDDGKPYGLHLPLIEHHWDGAQAKANAALIAAAPDLLEALKLALRQNEHDMVMTGDECRQCRAAITKAEDEK